MFIITLTYIKPLEEVDKYLKDHVVYLEEEYSKGSFIASGRMVPRTGGVILSKLESKKELEDILEKDPFKKAQLANYEIVEFIPSMTSKEFEDLIEL